MAGVMICPKHGRQSVARGCVHMRTTPDPLQLDAYQARLILFDSDGEMEDDEMWGAALCTDCARLAAIPSVDTDTSDPTLFTRLEQVAGAGECVACERERWDRSRLRAIRLRMPWPE